MSPELMLILLLAFVFLMAGIVYAGNDINNY